MRGEVDHEPPCVPNGGGNKDDVAGGGQEGEAVVRRVFFVYTLLFCIKPAGGAASVLASVLPASASCHVFKCKTEKCSSNQNQTEGIKDV